MTLYLIFAVMVLVVSHNCNGLRNVDKFKKYVSNIDERNFNICLLQETFWCNDFADSIKHMFNGKIWCSNSNSCRQGVAILVRNSIIDRVKFIHKDDDGRFIHVTYEEDDKTINFINIYAPNNVNDRKDFFNMINDYVSDLDDVVIGGDFNTSLSALDRANVVGHKEDGAFKTLEQMLENNDLYDVWRARNDRIKQFSFKRLSNECLQQSRIDYFLITRSMSNLVQTLYYNDTSMSDHAFVILNMNVAHNVERGPGLWVFNNTFLFNEEYVAKVKDIIEDEKSCPLYDSDLLIWWDNLKYKIKRYSQIYGSRKAKERRKGFYFLQNKFDKLSNDFAEGKKIDVTLYENLRLELQEYENTICKGAILRAKAKWAVDSDCNSKYFLSLEKHKQNSNCIKELLCNDGKIVSDTDGILEEEYNFYKSLYSCVNVDYDHMESLINCNDKRVVENDAIICDEVVSEDEVRKALFEMPGNKSPGSDGLTVEFYKHFYNELKDILMNVYCTIHEKKSMSRSMKIGIISLVYKNKGDKRLLKNYRPISLLQVDYKIIARVMANRFKHILPTVVSENQSCCIVGKDIANTICNIRDIIDLVEQDKLEGYVIKIDQEKAFDRVSHDYLLATLKKFGFGENFVKWIEIFYTDICSSCKSNGFLTKYFDIKNGIRQGCPISALLYVLAAESLQNAIQKNSCIKGISIPNSKRVGLVFQHADDTTLTVGNHDSIEEVFKVFDLYSEGSGAKINIEKSEILCIGTGYLNDDHISRYGLKVCNDVIQVLGVYIGRNVKECLILNWKEKLKKIKTILNLWLQRNLTLQGRCEVINALLLSRLWYTLSVYSIPESVMKEIKRCCINFLWSNGAHLLKYRTITGNKYEGGLQFQDIHLKMLALRLKFLSRLLDPNYNVLWKDTCKYFLHNIHNMNLDVELLFMTLYEKDLKNVPFFYKEMLLAWQYVKDKSNIDLCTDLVYRQPLFLNPLIKINDQVLFWKIFIDAGIVCIKDIAYEVTTGFLPVQCIVEMIQDVEHDVNIISIKRQYYQLLLALPSEWKNLVDNYENIKCKDNCSEFQLELKGKPICINQCRTNIYYQLLNVKCFCEADCIKVWTDMFEKNFNFTCIWKFVNFKWKPPDLIELDYKIVHNRLYTNEKLCKMGKIDSAVCNVCKCETEDIRHIFYSCKMLKAFHYYLKLLFDRLFENCNSDKISTVKFEQMLFLGIQCQLKGVNIYFLNFLLSVARFCIFKRRNLLGMKNVNLELIRFFRYTLKNYTAYVHHYCCKIERKRTVFEKYFLENNNILYETDDILMFNL